MFPGPVFAVELVTTARRGRYFAIRFLYGVILLFFILQNAPGYGVWGGGADMDALSIQEMSQLGEALFVTFVVVQSLAVLALTPPLVAGVIADERQRKTLHYLLASRLSSGEIILGKLGARMLHLGVLVAIGFPIMSLLSLFGGVDPAIVTLSFAATFTTAFFLSALSILVSTHARRPREAIGLVYVLEFFWLVVPTLTGVVMPRAGGFWSWLYSWIQPINAWVEPTSPFDVFGVISRAGSRGQGYVLESFAWMMGLQVAYGVLFVTVALLRLRRVNRNEGGGAAAAWLSRLMRGRRLLPRPACGDDAMLWKECYVSRTSLVVKLILILISVSVLCGLGYFTYSFAMPAFSEVISYGYGERSADSARNEFNGFLRIVCVLAYMVIAMAVASAASSGFTSEREEDTWISLVATPLESREIVRPKIVGAVWNQRWPLGVFAFLLVLGMAAGAVHPVGAVAVAVEAAVFLWFAAALGTSYSLCSKTSARSLVATMATLFILNGGYLMCCLPMRPDGFSVIAGVTPAVLGFSLASFEDVSSILNGNFLTWRLLDDVLFIVIIGIGGYAVAAVVLTSWAEHRFDEEAGRARRLGAVPPPGLKPITFLDELSDESSSPDDPV